VANVSSLLTVAHASGSDLIPCSSVANASSLLTVAHASGSDFIPLLCKPSLTLVSAKRLARKKNHRSIVGKEY